MFFFGTGNSHFQVEKVLVLEIDFFERIICMYPVLCRSSLDLLYPIFAKGFKY